MDRRPRFESGNAWRRFWAASWSFKGPVIALLVLTPVGLVFALLDVGGLDSLDQPAAEGDARGAALDEDAEAAALLLRPRDFAVAASPASQPPDMLRILVSLRWIAQPGAIVENDCGPIWEGPAAVGRAQTTTFSHITSGESISQALVIYEDRSEALRPQGRMLEFLDCEVAYFESDRTDNDDFQIVAASWSPLPFEELGDATSAYRLTVAIDVGQRPLITDRSGFVRAAANTPAEILLDQVLVSSGNVVFLVTAVQVLQPFDPEFLAELTRVLAAKLP